MEVEKKEIGVFGGSFDPVHKGHLLVAESALDECRLDEVWIMVSPENPLKSGSLHATEQQRLEMVNLALKELPDNLKGRIKGSDFEFHLPRPSFTFNTLQKLREAYPNHNFRWIIGEDNLILIKKWRNPERILEEFGMIIYPRKGEKDRKIIQNTDMAANSELDEFIKNNSIRGNIQILSQLPLLPYSSTSVRKAVMEKNYSFLRESVGERVAEYIMETFKGNY